MNGVDLSLFRFEYDLTWMAFFMDAEDHFYARYGGREDSSPESHLTQKSLVRTMRQVLKLHSKKAVAKPENVGAPAYGTPEAIPPMKGMMAKRKNSKCIHCHDVKVAALRHQQELKTFDQSMIFTYPTPRRVGIELHPDRQNIVRGVVDGSPAARAGLRSGDVILSANGQRVLTFGDLSRVLELTPREAQLSIKLERGGSQRDVTLELSGSWRRNADASWRSSTHVAGPGGGFWGVKLGEDARRRLGLGADDLALKVTVVWAPHAKKAGIKLNDVVVKIDDVERDLSIRQLHAHLQLERNAGDAVPVTVRRGGKNVPLTLKLPTQDH